MLILLLLAVYASDPYDEYMEVEDPYQMLDRLDVKGENSPSTSLR